MEEQKNISKIQDVETKNPVRLLFPHKTKETFRTTYISCLYDY